MSTVPPKVVEHNLHARLHDLFMDLLRASGLVEPDRSVPGHALSMSQAFALHELDTDPPLSQRDLAERLRLEKSTVSRLAADLERAGLLARERDPDNRRLYRLRLTERGRAMHRHLRGAYDGHFHRWMEAMTPQEIEGLLVGLPGLIRAMTAPAPAGGPSRTPHAAGRP
jgi:DNA-binding MarR family transcriptional regulator